MTNVLMFHMKQLPQWKGGGGDGVATRATGWTVWGSIPGKDKIYLLFKLPRHALGNGTLPAAVKQPGRGVTTRLHLLPKLRRGGSKPPRPYDFTMNTGTLIPSLHF